MTWTQITAFAGVFGSLCGAVTAWLHAYQARMAARVAKMHADRASAAVRSSQEQPPR